MNLYAEAENKVKAIIDENGYISVEDYSQLFALNFTGYVSLSGDFTETLAKRMEQNIRDNRVYLSLGLKYNKEKDILCSMVKLR